MRCHTLPELLRKAAQGDPSRGLIFYPLGSSITTAPTLVSYREFLGQAKEKSERVAQLKEFAPGRPVLLHFDSHWENILWFWAILLANGVPVPTPPLSNVAEHRIKHLQSLSSLLGSPICITSTKFIPSFAGDHGIKLYTTRDLKFGLHLPNSDSMGGQTTGTDAEGLAALMLTSGSTGNAKAVRLRHSQILAALAGKASVRGLGLDTPFLNFTGMDHVAALTELHLHALYHGVDQIHVHASDLLCSPRLFLDLLSLHEVSRTFAPNFFLAQLLSSPDVKTPQKWDFSNLKWLVSGGEANNIDICREISSLLSRFGAPTNVLSPGFGMTEICGGAIYNVNCPQHDLQNGYAVASVGTCIEGIEMRITRPDSCSESFCAVINETGDLEVRGAVVFDGYFNDDVSTAAAFTQDGWFRTGDRAFIDSGGHLNMVGRTKDVMNINGVKISPADLQSSLEKSLECLVRRVICFPSTSSRTRTEQITVAYVPQNFPTNPNDAHKINAIIRQTSVLISGATPFTFALSSEMLLPVTTLGKISRAKMRSLFEGGIFDQDIKAYHETLSGVEFPSSNVVPNKTELMLLEDFRTAFGDRCDDIGVDECIFEVGITSVDLIRLKRQLDSRLDIDIAISALINNPTARSLAAAIADLQSSTKYNPVVTLRRGGNKTPLWLVHPGIGEVLVFLGLANHMDDRPVYALRARGFDDGPLFANIGEAVDTYCTAITSHQAKGPYAIAGYSYGTMLAFEIVKVLESRGAEVPFFGSFNLPPHIKTRMRQLTWNVCLLYLACFLDLVTDEYAESIEGELRRLDRRQALQRLLNISDANRLAELGMDEQKLTKWTDVAYGLQNMAVDYEASGMISSIDVFHAIPLRVAASSRADWIENHLSKWEDFCRTSPRFHEVGGEHYTMLSPTHVSRFSNTLNRALEARGI
ncbi:acetyl-CoA synthetase-like protein [Westerdykella ornata]|uniref:Acetyl-CoA synthetase-like protein n=1 Tax=Westerdykella ornata TaxID=318751 RepID=A0A6A6JV14_WESOR|nr:acetyl-CoA synthetase-like protein [Westerdykella ornata]KAF2280227.1 acetyl-CoA synthetase-like protein [Westerdykella ornata]